MSLLAKKLNADRARIGKAPASVGKKEPPEAADTAPMEQRLTEPERISANDSEAEGPPTDSEVKEHVTKAAEDKKTEAEANAKKAADDLYVFFDLQGVARLKIQYGNGKVDTPNLESTAAQDHIRCALEQATGKRAGKDLIESLMARKRNEARTLDRTHEVNLRIASEGQGVILDMSSEDGKVICVDAGGYRTQPQGGTFFARGAGVGALPEPAQYSSARDAEIVLRDYLGHIGIDKKDHGVQMVVLAEWMRPIAPAL